MPRSPRPRAALLLAIALAACGVRLSTPERVRGAAPGSPCETVADCAAPPEPCLVAACVEGGCRVENAPASTVPEKQQAGDCKELVCDGRGEAITRRDLADEPADDHNECTDEACDGDEPKVTPVAAGARCGNDGVCTGTGVCGVCLPGSGRCSSNALESCDANGQWAKGAACAEGAPVCTSGGCAAVAEIGMGARHACARLANGAARCWGSNRAGQLGGDANARHHVAIASVAELALGRRHSCARLDDGTAACWGSNELGELGDGANERRASPAPVLGIKGATQIASGDGHTCARLGDGTVWCWGSNELGELGDGANERRASPAPVLGIKGATQIASGDGHTCARLGDGTVWCWGKNDAGQLGDGSVTPLPRRPPAHAPSADRGPVGKVETAGPGAFAAIAAGGEHTCARLTSGGVECWGDDSYGQLGGGTALAPAPPPPPPPKPAAKPGPSRRPHTGAGAPPPSKARGPKPRAVRGIKAAVEIAAGGDHACARLKDGSVHCWGANEKGQLGDGGAAAHRAPGRVPAIAGATAIAVGRRHTCALLAAGSVTCWGDNEKGQLGDGGTAARKAPVAVKGLAGVVAIAAGGDRTCARLASGSAVCWGDEPGGPQASPTAVAW